MAVLFRAGQSERPVPLKPFVFRTRDGFMIGLAMDPQKGAPCAGCAELWLRSRHVWVEKAEISDLNVRRDLLADLLAENSAHVFYEIDRTGNETRLDCVVFPHPECACDRGRYIAPPEISKKTNFAFSPILQLKCARFGTPEGNLWLTTAVGDSPLAGQRLVKYGTGKDRESSRLKAVDEWLKQAAMSDLQLRLDQGETMPGETLQNGKRELMTPSLTGAVGSGKDRESATLDALYRLARMRTLKRYSTSMRNPMLVVGTNNWLRGKIPFFLLQQYDLHLLFYPNSMPVWVVGVAAFSRVRTDEKPIFAFGSHADINEALEMGIGKILELCRPGEWESTPAEEKVEGLKPERVSKLNSWWTNWIYRCAKISLKDVLHLEAYPRDVNHWREFFRDGETPLNLVSLNGALIPAQIRSLVSLSQPAEASLGARNVNGIATWSTFSDSV